MSNLYFDNFKLGLKPDPILTVSEWADTHRVLSQVSSSEPGYWRTSRTPYLEKVMDCLSSTEKYEEIIFSKGAQIGAALTLDTKLPTPKGFTTMGEVKVGDTVFDENGNQCKVTFKSKVFKNHKCFKITFSDKSVINCDAQHRWTVWDEKKYENRKLVTLDTSEIFETFKNKNRNRYAIDVSKPIDCSKKKLPIDPYLLGVWLGDGNRHTGILYLNKNDSFEILEKINKKVRVKLDSENCVECLVDGFCKTLRLNSLLKKEKQIPQAYLRASFKQRVNLLNGLMDTDGSIANNRCEYSTVDEALYKTVYELLMTLGIKASVYESWCKGETPNGPRKSEPRKLWRISFTVFDFKVFNLKRKQSLMKTTGRISETRKRRIVNVEKIKTEKTQCIEVNSESHLYLCGEGFIATHNTECGNNWVGYIIHHAPGPILSVMPTLTDAKKNSKIRITPLIEASPVLKERVKDARVKDSGNTVFQKDFPGGTLFMTGANSAAGLASMPARYLFLDEVDRYPGDVEGEGDPILLAKARTRTFSKRKIFMCSTPTIEGRSRIDTAFEETDKNYYFVPCPHCDEMQRLIWTQVKWDKENPDGAWYECEHCNERIENWQKTKMLKAGEWRPTVPEKTSKKIIGFHLSALYSPVGWASWGELATQWTKAQVSKEQLRGFVNTVLGETWQDKGEAPDWQRLYERQKNYEPNEIPNPVVFLTAGVDVQKDRLEVEIVGWARNKVSYSIDYRVFMGDTSSVSGKPWQELSAMMGELWTKGSVDMPIKMTCVDSGYNTQTVYTWCRQYPITKVVAIKGNDTQSTIISQPKPVDVKVKGRKLRGGLKMFSLGVNILKSELYGFLKLDVPEADEPEPYGFCHFPDYDSEFFKMLTAEELVIKHIKGYKKYEWQKIRDRNEALDTRNYARAAAALLGIDRYKEAHWTKLESEAQVKIIKNNDKSLEKEQNNQIKEKKTANKVKITRRKSSYL